MNIEVNYVAIIVATVAGMATGALWYSPVLFAKQWMAATGKTMDQMKGTNMGRTYGTTALLTLLTSYILAHFIVLTNSDTLALGLQTAFWAWLGFTAPQLAVNSLFEGRSMKLFVITAGHHLACLLVMGAILASWR